MQNFAWQKGYGAFAVSISHIPETFVYRGAGGTPPSAKLSEEYLAFLKRHEIAYDENYLWD